jgi:hypothetical protein
MEEHEVAIRLGVKSHGPCAMSGLKDE